MKSKHHGSGTKSVKAHAHDHAKGNLKLKGGGQTIHVTGQKDRMTKNVGNHMDEGMDERGPSQPIMKSGGGKKPFVKKSEF